MERIDKINKLIDSIALYDYLEGTSEIKYKKENELKEEMLVAKKYEEKIHKNSRMRRRT